MRTSSNVKDFKILCPWNEPDGIETLRLLIDNLDRRSQGPDDTLLLCLKSVERGHRTSHRKTSDLS